MLVIWVLAGGLVWYAQAQDQAQYNKLSGQYNALYSDYNAVRIANGYLNGSLNAVQQEMELLLQNYDHTSLVSRSPADNASVAVWTRDQSVPAHTWTAWALLDTFINNIDITSNSSARFMIMDLPTFVRFATNQTYVPFVTFTGTHFLQTERISQGCATYVLVINNDTPSPILLRPNVTATFAPTPFLTGQCSLSP